jgi:hypothetical protein
MDSLALASLAEVVVGAHRAHEADALDWVYIATIAGKLLVDLLLLLSLALLEMLVEHASELDRAVFANFIADDLNKLAQILRVNHSSAVALSAWESLLVDLRAKALDAGNFVLDALLLAAWDDDLATDLSLFDVADELRAHFLHSNSVTINTHISRLLGGLRPHVAGFDLRVYSLVLHVDLGGVAASIILRDEVVDICSDVNSVHEDIFVATTDLVSGLSLDWPDFGHASLQIVRSDHLKVVQRLLVLGTGGAKRILHELRLTETLSQLHVLTDGLVKLAPSLVDRLSNCEFES